MNEEFFSTNSVRHACIFCLLCSETVNCKRNTHTHTSPPIHEIARNGSERNGRKRPSTRNVTFVILVITFK